MVCTPEMGFRALVRGLVIHTECSVFIGATAGPGERKFFILTIIMRTVIWIQFC